MKQLLKSIGKGGTITLEGLLINVIIVDVKVSYGRVRYLVTPISGRGEVWKEDVLVK